MNIFVDGQIVMSRVGDFSMIFPSDPKLSFGVGVGGGLPGTYTDGRFYPFRMTAAQAQALFEDDIDPGALCIYDFSELSGTSVSDSLGVGPVLTATGAVWSAEVPSYVRGYYQNLNANSGNPSLWAGTGLTTTGNTTPSPIAGTLLYEVKEVASGTNVRRLAPGPNIGAPILAPNDQAVFYATGMVIKAGTRKNVGVATGVTQTGGQFNTTVTPFTVSTVGLGSYVWGSLVEDLGGGAYLCIWCTWIPSGGVAGSLFFNDDTGNGNYAVSAGSEKTAWVGNSASVYSRISKADAMQRCRDAIMSGVVTGSKPVLYGPPSTLVRKRQNLIPNGKVITSGGTWSGVLASGVLAAGVANPVDGGADVYLLTTSATSSGAKRVQSPTDASWLNKPASSGYSGKLCRSVFAKPAGYNYLAIADASTVAGYFTWDVTTGQPSTADNNLEGWGSEYWGNGWWRIWHVVDHTRKGGPTLGIALYPSFASDPATAQVGDGVNGVLVYCPQMNPGDYPQPPALTTGSMFEDSVRPLARSPNLIIVSDSPDGWGRTGISSTPVVDGTLAPDGSPLFRIVENSSNSGHYVTPVWTNQAVGALVTYWALLHPGTRRYVGLSLLNPGGEATFDLQNPGTVINKSSAIIDAGSFDVGSGCAVAWLVYKTAIAPATSFIYHSVGGALLAGSSYLGDGATYFKLARAGLVRGRGVIDWDKTASNPASVGREGGKRNALWY
jgi:hypothetical protein